MNDAEGIIEVESEVGKGSEFRISLPESENNASYSDSALILPMNIPGYDVDFSNSESAGAENSGSRIFIVEDNNELRDFLTEFFFQRIQGRVLY